MHHMHDRALRWLPGMDVNLLVALDALLREGHVTRAARRVGLSQSAMSHALARLRVLLDDPLLVRGSRGMLLTPRAERMARPLAEALMALDGAVGPPAPFDASTIERELTLAAIDFAQLVFVAPLMELLAREAPGLSLVVVPPAEPIERALVSGAVDLALGLARPGFSLRQEELSSERFVCVVRKNHPAARRARLRLRDYARLPHVVVSPRGRVPGAADAALRARGLERRVVLTVPHALTAALFVARSDAVLTIAERVAASALRALPLRVLEPPLELSPFRVTMQWHPRLDGDPVHAFVRGKLASIA